MKKFRVFVDISLLGVLFLLSSCPGAFELPEKVRVKSNADISLNIPESEVNMDRILDDMQDEDGRMKIYEYTPPNPPPSWDGAKAYLIRYELGKIEFLSKPVQAKIEVDGVDLDPITIPTNANLTVNVTFDTSPTINAGTVSFPSGGNFSAFGLAGASKITIADGGLTITAYDASENPISTFDYSGLQIKLGSTLLTSIGNGVYRLNGAVIDASTSPEINGSITNSGPPIEVKKFTLTPEIERFSEVEIQTTSDHSDQRTEFVDLSDIPNGVNAIKFTEIGVALEFWAAQNGPPRRVRVKGLPVALSSSALDFSTGYGTYPTLDSWQNTGCRITDGDSLSFIKNDHILRFNESIYTGGIWVDKHSGSSITITVNPPIEGKYARITCYDLAPGELQLSVSPRVIQTLNEADINLNTLAVEDGKEDKRRGTFPDDPQGLEVKSMFKDMGEIGESVNFEQLDLYLYMNGDEYILKGTKLTLTAQSDVPKMGFRHDSLATERPLEHLGVEGPVFPNAAKGAVRDDVFTKGNSGTAQFYTPGLADIINRKPHNLWLDYKITLADHAIIPGAKLGSSDPISIRPEVILVMPMRMFMAEDGTEFGAVKFTDEEADGEKMIGIELTTDMDMEFDL